MAMNYLLFIAEVEFYSEYDDKEKTNWSIVPADNYKGAMEQVLEDWGEDCLISVKLTAIGDECGGSFSISETLADALIHDLPEDLYVTPTEWRRKQMEKNGK